MRGGIAGIVATAPWHCCQRALCPRGRRYIPWQQRGVHLEIGDNITRPHADRYAQGDYQEGQPQYGSDGTGNDALKGNFHLSPDKSWQALY
jgi:hypothetical protein